MSIGTTLKAARERSGLTIAQVAEQTRMIHQLVEDIEQDDFHRIIAAVYGRGFIKLFAECVGEDPAPLVQEFNEIYSGARRPAVRTRAVQTAQDEPDTVEAADAAPHRPKVRAVTVPDEEPSPKPEPAVSGRDAPTARPQPDAGGRVVETTLPDAKDASDASGKDALTERPQPAPQPEADGRFAEKSLPNADVGDAPTERPQPAPQPVAETAPEVAPPPRQTVKPAESEVKPVSQPESLGSDMPETDEGSLGELFDLGNRAKAEPRAEKAASPADSKGEGAKLNLPLTQQAPSWNDAPLSEGDFWQKLSNLDKWKHWKPAAAIAGLCLLAVVVLGVLAARRNRPQGGNVAVAAQPDPSGIPAAPASAPTAAMETAGKSVYTDNLVPPPDSYVD